MIRPLKLACVAGLLTPIALVLFGRAATRWFDAT